MRSICLPMGWKKNKVKRPPLPPGKFLCTSCRQVRPEELRAQASLCKICRAGNSAKTYQLRKAKRKVRK